MLSDGIQHVQDGGDKPRRSLEGWGTRLDIGLALLFAVSGATFSWYASARLHPLRFIEQGYYDWFDADVPRVYECMTERFRKHYRTHVHPLFPLAAYPPTRALFMFAGLPQAEAVRVTVAAGAGLWAGALFGLLRLLCGRRPDAVVFASLGCVSASAIFWLGMTETYAWGSLSIIAALGLVGLAERKRIAEGCFVAASALTLSFTVTNWMAGIVAAVVRFPRRRAVQITINAFAVVVVLWGVQKAFFPLTDFFLDPQRESGFVLSPDAGGPVAASRAFFLHSMIAPRIAQRDHVRQPLTVQASAAGSAGLPGRAGVILWCALLLVGTYGLLFGTGDAKLRLAIGITLGGQWGLHVLYGEETFLYSLHYVPLLVALAAMSAQSRLRRPALVLAAALVLVAVRNNAVQFNQAAEMIRPAGLGDGAPDSTSTSTQSGNRLNRVQSPTPEGWGTQRAAGFIPAVLRIHRRSSLRGSRYQTAFITRRTAGINPAARWRGGATG